MNNCLVLLLLLCSCGNNNTRGCGGDIPDNCGCGGRDARDSRDSRNDGRCRDRERDRDDSCRGGFGPFPSPGSTCGCEEKDS